MWCADVKRISGWNMWPKAWSPRQEWQMDFNLQDLQIFCCQVSNDVKISLYFTIIRFFPVCSFRSELSGRSARQSERTSSQFAPATRWQEHPDKSAEFASATRGPSWILTSVSLTPLSLFEGSLRGAGADDTLVRTSLLEAGAAQQALIMKAAPRRHMSSELCSRNGQWGCQKKSTIYWNLRAWSSGAGQVLSTLKQEVLLGTSLLWSSGWSREQTWYGIKDLEIWASQIKKSFIS